LRQIQYGFVYLQLARFEFSEPVLDTKVEEFATLPAKERNENATRHIG
jgi:hypothetical protein